MTIANVYDLVLTVSKIFSQKAGMRRQDAYFGFFGLCVRCPEVIIFDPRGTPGTATASLRTILTSDTMKSSQHYS